MQTNRPARERSARQDREPHCEQTDAIETPSVTDPWQPWLELEAVEAWLETSRVFYNLSLTLNLGQHTAILGPNGSGKSTLVRLIDRSMVCGCYEATCSKSSEFHMLSFHLRFDDDDYDDDDDDDEDDDDNDHGCVDVSIHRLVEASRHPCESTHRRVYGSHLRVDIVKQVMWHTNCRKKRNCQNCELQFFLYVTF